MIDIPIFLKMRWILSGSLLGLSFLLWVLPLRAEVSPGLRQPSPLRWMHASPVGEAPGWQNRLWTHLEVNWANIWNAPHTMEDTRNGNQLEYFADFEQVSTILDMGFAPFERLALSLEVPYATRSGGSLDSFIDGYHVAIGNRRYNRQYYPENDYNYSVKTNGEEYYVGNKPSRAVANLKPKMKLWLWKWENQGCPCGLSVSVQGKVPMQHEIYGATTGDYDVYSLLHLGIPLGQMSSLFMTAAFSYLGDNPAMKDWPRNRKYEMYETTFDFAINKEWGIGFMARAESPYLEAKHLRYIDNSPDPKIVERNRASSGWNSLVRWRGSNAAGLRYRPTSSVRFSFWIIEDWGIGPYDASDNVYSNGAPDVNFVLQSSFGW